MEQPSTPPVSENRVRHCLRALRPLFWWIILVLVLFGIRTHQRLMQQTRLNFSVLLNGQPPFLEASATLDGKPAFNGQLITLGNHSFTVAHPKGEPFSTNLFIWYGGHDFGQMDLKRVRGVLAVTVDPPAPLLIIRGPEYNVTLTNSSGIKTSIPTDQYWVETQYRYWQKSQQIIVSGNTTTPLTIAPRMGALQLACNQTEATFQLLRLNSELLETGDFPATIANLPEGTYQLFALHHNHRRVEKHTVKAGATNNIQVDIKYGTAVLETKPPGASVSGKDGRDWGVTPLNLTELQPGAWDFTLRLNNYEPVTVSLDIAANETTTVRTNLISQSYTGAMRTARQFMDAADYDRAAEALGDALRAQPNDPGATSLQREAIGLGSIRRADALGKQGDYIAGIKELNTALTALPDNERAKLMFADFKQHEPEQIEKNRLERLHRGEKVFDTALLKHRDADLFDRYELKTAKPVKEVQTAILNELKIPPALAVTKDDSTAPETFVIEAAQEFNTILATSAGRRVCVIVGAHTRDDETQILFKILEYKTEAAIKFSIGNLIGAPVSVNYVAIHPSRIGTVPEKLQARLNEGKTNVTARIQGAIGQAPTPSSP